MSRSVVSVLVLNVCQNLLRRLSRENSSASGLQRVCESVAGGDLVADVQIRCNCLDFL